MRLLFLLLLRLVGTLAHRGLQGVGSTQRQPETTEAGPEVESCSPRLLRLARDSALGGCGLSAGVLAPGPVEPFYASELRWLRRTLSRHIPHARARERAVRMSPWTPRPWLAGLRHSLSASSRRRDLRASGPGDIDRRPRTRRPRPVRRVSRRRQHQRHRCRQPTRPGSTTRSQALGLWRGLGPGWLARLGVLGLAILGVTRFLRAFCGSTVGGTDDVCESTSWQSEAHGVESGIASALVPPVLAVAFRRLRSGATCGFRRSSPCPSSSP